MLPSINVSANVPAAFKDTDVAPLSAEKMAKDLKQAISASAVGIKVDAQVLDTLSGAKARFENAGPRELKQYLDTSKFSEAESQSMMNMFLAVVVQRENEDPVGAKSDPVSALLNFDPSKWEKHIGVMIAAIIATNIARQASAELSAAFTQISFESAKAQGVAIVKAGEAAMYAAIAGAVVSGGMAVGGAGLSLKGHAQKHTDIKTNQMDARNFDLKAAAADRDLKSLGQTKMPAGTDKASGINSKGETTVLKAQKDADHLVPDEVSALESVKARAEASASSARLQSNLAQKMIDRNITVGNTLSTMSSGVSAGMSAILRLGEATQREIEVQRQAEQGLNKSTADLATQNVSDNNSALLKLLEVMSQVIEGRNATNSGIASARA
ncbi:hypothetical protein [Pseudomonas fluorescens]|uniref:Uncharacterized protein n=1 Tax=Pseudomonas fluorescens TaxID=294 RepID=A0A5E7GB07_PSEFL|nr:hypothetical protein [Pseudomonas fluorescens]VVO48554.1 hypothetical protein PS880_00177 [Pseudomonas fluorescens]